MVDGKEGEDVRGGETQDRTPTELGVPSQGPHDRFRQIRPLVHPRRRPRSKPLQLYWDLGCLEVCHDGTEDGGEALEPVGVGEEDGEGGENGAGPGRGGRRATFSVFLEEEEAKHREEHAGDARWRSRSGWRFDA